MSRILITGSAEGLGLESARQLLAAGHEVVLHARSASRAQDARAAAPGAADVLVGDLGSLAETKALAEQATGFDAVVHNAGLGYREGSRVLTGDGIERVFQVNVLAPYVLTALAPAPRLVYLSSGLHRSGDPSVADVSWEARPWNALQAYSDSKLFDAMLAAAVARLSPDVQANAVEPGWVATKMGGAGAPDDLTLGGATQAWLATTDDEVRSGAYFFHRQERGTHPAVTDTAAQDALLARCAELSGERLRGVAGSPARPD